MLFRMSREYFCECCEFYKTFEEMHGDNDTICAVCEEGQDYSWEYLNANDEEDVNATERLYTNQQAKGYNVVWNE